MNKPLAISQIDIAHFRGLNDLSLGNLSCVNVFAGANNSGKTSVLEAVRLMSSPSNIGQLVRLSMLRASSTLDRRNTVNYVLSVFQKDLAADSPAEFYHIQIGATIFGVHHLFEADGSITEVIDETGDTKPLLELTVKTSDNQGSKPNYYSEEIVDGETKQFTATEKKLFLASYLHSTVNYYKSTVQALSGYMVREGTGKILEILASFDSNIDDINIIGEDVYLHNRKTGALPLFTYGSGMQKAVYLAVAIASCKDGVILIDEIDNTIHVSALEQVFKWFLDACLEYNVQAFITTHSAEALDAILRITHEQHETDDLLRIITLRNDPATNTTRKRIRTGEEAYRDREDYELELRI